jgi:uroporphyrinogen decarboxylase
MTHRERVRAILHYEPYDRMPVVAFGYWQETVEKWADEGFLPRELARDYPLSGDGSETDAAIMEKLGFDLNWTNCVRPNTVLYPPLPEKVIETLPDGSIIKNDAVGHIVRVKPGVTSIPAEIGTLLTGREAWEELFLPRLRFCEERLNAPALMAAKADSETRELPLGLYCGGLYGSIRDMLGVEHLSYLMADDEDLHEEIIDTCGKLSYQAVRRSLEFGVEFDFAHFWEDICFKNGPLVRPQMFRELVGPHYRRITSLLKQNGIDIVSLDCDGVIDQLLPIWLENGVNTMFPIEVGTWDASIAPWRAKYGKALLGVGGMDKRVFSKDRAAVDREIERLKPLVDLGGYIPCPDHRIAPDAKFELVQYYCDRFRKAFG